MHTVTEIKYFNVPAAAFEAIQAPEATNNGTIWKKLCFNETGRCAPEVSNLETVWIRE